MKHIIVPATSANMGSGFDSVGIAFQKYNHLWYVEIEEGLQILVNKKQDLKIPTDESNLIYKTIKDFFQMVGKPMPGIRLIQEDYIPHTRGLGSSAACIVAGLIAANDLSGYGVLQNQLLLDFYIGTYCSQRPDHLQPPLQDILRLGAYQILYLEKVPDSAAVNSSVELAKYMKRGQAAGLVNAVLRKLSQNKDQIGRAHV